jgi:hypothetical protein
MKKNYKLYEAFADIPGSTNKISLRKFARSMDHAKQLMMIDLRKRARERAKEGEQPQPLFLDQKVIREVR